MSDDEIHPGPSRVLIVDGDARVRCGLRALLEGEPNIEVAGEAATAAQAVQCDATLRPSMTLLDLMLPTVQEGLEVIRLLVKQGQPCLVISWRDSLREAAMAAGASGFVEKGAAPEVVLAAVQAACRDVQRQLREHLKEAPGD